MAVKIADTLKALSNTFPVAECVDIDVNINGTTKRLQKAIDDGEIGGGSDSTWQGTHEEWEALSTEEKGKYEVVYFTDDYDSSGIGSDSSWKGTKEEWENLLPTEKEKYEVIYFTDDYDGSGIGIIDSSWEGTLEEWEALSTEEKGKYEVVYLTNDYDDSGLIDDNNISNNTTYSSTKIENSLSNKANATDLTAHTGNASIHVTTSDKTKWNKVDNKIDKTDIVDNLTSTNTNKPLSANQGKVLKDEIDNKANDNEVIKKTAITNTIDSTSTDTQVPSASAIYHKSKNGITEILTNNDIIAYADTIGAQMVTDNVKIMNGINSPYGVDNTSNDFHYTIYNINNENFKRIVAYDIRKNDMYTIIKRNGKWSDWQRVCTTNVDDVAPTTITFTSTTNYEPSAVVGLKYTVSNGICYISGGIYCVSPSSSETLVYTFPKPKAGNQYCKTIGVIKNIDDTNTVTMIIGLNGELNLTKGVAGGEYRCTFSYPVA